MANDLNKNAEFEGKHKEEEDPILVAQRYLNIFHQIHIFNKNRQKQFDDSLIELPSEIRILLSTLPGGSLLLDHIAEIEEKRGIISAPSLDEEPSKKEKTTTSKIEDVKNSSSQNGASGNSNLSNNILKVLKQNEEQHEKEIKALTDAFLKSQENMANILQQILEKQPLQNDPIPVEEETSVKSVAHSSLESPSDKTLKPSEAVQSVEQPQTNENETTTQSESSGIFSGIAKMLFAGKSKETKEGAGIAEDKSKLEDLLDRTTPVSLDDIKDEPVSLDHLDENLSIQSSSKETKQQGNLLDEDFISAFQNNKNDLEEKQSIDQNQDDDDDWEWEYVEEPDSNSEQTDDEWEYVEEPVEDSENADGMWEYVEEPIDNSENAENKWEYLEEPVEGSENDNKK